MSTKVWVPVKWPSKWKPQVRTVSFQLCPVQKQVLWAWTVNTPSPPHRVSIRHSSTGPGIQMPGSASFPGLTSHGEAVAVELHTSQQVWGASNGSTTGPGTANIYSHFLCPFSPAAPCGPPAQFPQSLACVQTGPTRRGQVIRIKPNVFAYPQHEEGNQRCSDMIYWLRLNPRKL